jgi:hypothetical protein
MGKAAIALVLLAATVAVAATDQEKFGKFLGKFATDVAAKKPKGACVCTEGPSQHRTGHLVLFGVQSVQPPEAYFQIACNVRTFDPATGELLSNDVCNEFLPIAK